MEQLNQQAEILKLGRKIIKELTPDDDNGRLTLLEKWMGHYIAELILKIEQEDSVSEKERFQKECFGIILKLWEKRNISLNESMPLSKIKCAINVLCELKRERNSWERIQDSGKNSWEGLAVKIYESYVESIKICVQSSIVHDAMSWEKAWLNDYSQYLSDDEKELIEKLDDFLEESPTAISIVIKDSEEETDTKMSKNRREKVFDRLEAIVDNQKEVIRILRENIMTKK
jgi:hypothetical protein